MASPTAAKRPARSTSSTPDPRFDWRRIAYHTLASRALDDFEEELNRQKASVPREDQVLYQFSARGHDMAQVILGSLLTGRRDAAGAYYRSRPLLLTLGLTLEDAHGSPLGRAGGFSDGRDIGVVVNLPRAEGCVVLPMSGDVGAQYTPAAGWAQAITYHRDSLGDAAWQGSIAVALGGDGSVATNGFWSALTMATTLSLPMLFYIEDNGLGISVRGDMQTPGANIAKNLASFANLLVRDGNGSDPANAAATLYECVQHVREGRGPALVRLTVPRLSSHSGPDNQKGYRSDADIQQDWTRDPLPNLKAYLVPSLLSADEWTALEADVQRDVQAAVAAARQRPHPDPAQVARHRVEETLEPGEAPAMGGLPDAVLAALPTALTAATEGPVVRVAEAIRRTLDTELAANPRLLVFGEDVGVKGGVHLVTEGLQKKHGVARVFDTSLSEEGIIGRAAGLAISGLMPVAEIQFRKYADPAMEQLNNAGTVRWRTANRFCSPMVVRMPGGFGKDVGDPWHSVSNEVMYAHAVGWQVVMPSNAADAAGLLRAAMRSRNPTVFFEHRALLMTSDGATRWPGDDYVVPLGQAKVLREGTSLTLVTWGAMVHRCAEAVEAFGDRVELIDLRSISPWDRAAVIASVTKTHRALIVHEDQITAGFGAEIAATLAKDCFWFLDAPVERVAVADIPMPYHPALMAATAPSVERVAAAIEQTLSA
ncbi:MAG: transketolase C-terminal domain-containing protein [Gemmatimonadaceae bacterium]|nr:transketolase C-terminal domain-containing protein [Gemmatimonadaceae bacterium]